MDLAELWRIDIVNQIIELLNLLIRVSYINYFLILGSPNNNLIHNVINYSQLGEAQWCIALQYTTNNNIVLYVFSKFSISFML